jgi:hypothetical protein
MPRKPEEYNTSASRNPSSGSNVVVAAPPQNVRNRNQQWLIAVGAGLAMILIGGVLHGKLSNRWGVPVNALELGEKLRSVPLELGPWVSEPDREMPKSTLSLLECEGYLNRIYVHRGTGEAVSVAVLFGPKGPIAVHTPEICYDARNVGKSTTRESTPNTFDGTANSLWKLSFTSNTLEKSKLNVAYGWSDGGPWLAAEHPRFWATDYLYKIQTASQATSGKQDSTDAFLRLFLPEVRKHMRESKS